MAFLDKNIIECISAKVTDLGRKRIAEGNFNLLYFKVGDSEYDYNFSSLDEMVIHPVELDMDLKYPLLMDTTTKIDYGPIIDNESITILTENIACDPDVAWKMNIVWTEKPAGLDNTYENLSGYGSNAYASAKEYFGYTSISGQTNNVSTSFVTSTGEKVIVNPKDQKTIAIVHYSGEHYDVYEDWLASDDAARAYFALSLPNLSYHRNSGSTIGYTFTMSSEGGYVQSTVNNSAFPGEPYKYLIDDNGYNVGKIFVGKRVIVIDDEEICAALSSNSLRTWTLPAPRVALAPLDLACTPDSGDPLLSGTTKDAWVTYTFNALQMHCNYYSKVEGTNGTYNISMKFGNEFKFLNLDYTATAMYALVQLVDKGDRPSPDGWMLIDITSQLPGVSGNITASNIVNSQLIITKSMYDSGTLYELSDFIGAQPLENGGQGSPQFGDETTLPGLVNATRATNIHEMNMIVNLPGTQFVASQNPTKLAGVNARVTEIGLYNEAKELLVIGKMSSPKERVGFQQFSLKIDF
jgi:hypothetical protein